MKIAVACNGNNISQHFGHCEGFYIFQLENEGIGEGEFVKNPGHKPGFLPKYLAELNINTIISGGMGAAAVNLFNENNIEVVVGATGDAKENVIKYTQGQLQSTGSICHEHEGECH